MRTTKHSNLGARLADAGTVADFLAMPRTEVYKLVAAGELPAVRVGRRIRFRPEDVLQFVEDHREVPP
jgi:excisionase family DNA binding protein